MRIVIGITGASGAIYAQRLLHFLSSTEHEIHVIISNRGKQVIGLELGRNLEIPKKFGLYSDNTMEAPFVSGSSRFDAMVIIPCSMGTVGRIAQGISNSTITRSADVFLKERRKLILVIRETPLHLIHLRNLATLTEAGALILPACPSFYGLPSTIEELVDSVNARVLDHLGIENSLSVRWREHF
ncbi:3-octaprenyl-4-hydroxybenzoate carboxy-lyase [Candidatus Methylacidiphilum fumarolicum]|uniref:Flavin prenyltransferase UbiX n=2 Tax=Candidatus Methylacidiphilum fumarolicum TaxID=591154 RepID=I0JYH7_METFB|nr:UbiX family flavin prenyltransferase [Candidatus Methylacidiphilum fumarolicum]MBW6416020.1 UbiX family flavin prenyltransferase [Candidatus Methylacidiphilum fumarolicum]TFE67133.1 3-octaprenyl-4-hydroxybenzoate carboxy-lyase [Candidatus Methylacidiphilum fumarolicum]TFE71955.1 3-octaprenyl-4-hydroxybenzoate carboxy-lyase [Candidatus Methylacidiphilum fumarolicum]TFE73917.1 3-octaprenyl-4-hydroxybenzoate carboxy-lyase [Candidatus Methylacidiphilum fumarolicum]TFE73920.1 3-octaprenyl-4-hydr